MIRLTDEEIWEIDSKLCDGPLYIEECYGDKALLYSIGQFNKAQLKKVYDWGNEVCMDKSHHPHFDCMYRHCCLECWQALLKEIE